MTAPRQAHLGANGRVLAPEVSPAGSAPEAATGRDTVRDGASHARLAELYRALAEEHARLAAEGQVQLAVAGERALMSLVPATATGPLASASRDPLPDAPYPRDFGRLLSVRDVADLLAVDERTIRRWRREGRLPNAVEVCGVIRWRPEVVDQWILDREAQR